MYNDESETVTETALAGTPAPGPAGGERLIAGRYRLLSRLGEGGMGTVWRAHDETLYREVAVKEVRPPAGLGGDDIARMYGRLEREAWAAARIPDRNVVTVHDVVMEDNRPWVVMELIRGQSLADLLRAEGPLTPRHAAHIGAEVLGALRAAHAVGVEHRDVKPANVLLADDGRVVLSDFGIAMVEGSTSLTMTGEVVGSPEYLPPERALGRPSGPESDLWSLGVMLYACVEGISPFRQDSALSTLRSVVEEEPPVPTRAGPLAPVIAGLLRKEPAQRTPAAEAAEALRDIAHDPDATTAAARVLSTPAEAATGRTGATDEVAAVTAPPRKRRTAAFVAAGTAACVLIGGGIAYALNGNNEATNPDSGVRVSVTGANTTYTGACPVPAGRAPSFTVTFTASEPTLISYRWVSGDGSVVDPHWRTLSIGGKAAPTGRDTVSLTTYTKTGTLTTGMAVELQSPAPFTSNPVPFSITCTG
ncbi:serine/threonine-protein kinase [Streptomyces nojiriensis]|uniref:non-specific serine/threonine protein kinase n=1 Tax=Streptomyces nojiriensis TaxID=66374 RepID=A0ABQ3SMW1_9ACTN|nr:serine/threonine-protein kinase [Streptomyces nojiriensis]QTI42966.1 Serine/threonine-protein kinase PrkC [Streptomyces nojiriensis]GGS32931.1 protein kinase [Streptomyces nojiriensis]GHI69397.1 protein kinase [Streptomyces nojiriensis]